MINLKQLPYQLDALEPFIDAQTVEIHYGKHHQGYVNKLNELIANTEFENMDLENIILKSSGAIFNNAAQVWNHTFYWECLGKNEMNDIEINDLDLVKKIIEKWESLENFKSEFLNSAVGNFGSGWTWLVKNKGGGLEIVNTSNAANPITDGNIPVLTVDVWEHAYYLKYQNRRAEYLENRWNLVNWAKIDENYGN